MARVSNEAKMSEPLASVNQPEASAPLAHPSTWISLVGPESPHCPIPFLQALLCGSELPNIQ